LKELKKFWELSKDKFDIDVALEHLKDLKLIRIKKQWTKLKGYVKMVELP
jgi:hypothetical protein